MAQRNYTTVRHYLFFDVSFITVREGVDVLGDDDVIGADVAVTIAPIDVRTENFVDGDVIIIVDQITQRVWFADFIRPEWTYTRIGSRRLRWEIATGAELRHYCLTFATSPELVRFMELFLAGRRAALGWQHPGALALDVMRNPEINEQPAGGRATIVEVDNGYQNLIVAFVKLFFGLAMVRVVMVISDRVVDSFMCW